ncbi:hypothetical protein ACFLYR_06185 [Chloroflexota bacterium]
MLEGTCPKCGKHYYGWALSELHSRYCGSCGVKLELKDNGVRIIEDSPPSEENGPEQSSPNSGDELRNA